jgi:murein DD-endopeptidase MepM/ murein hydrolase activator NlpD
MIGNAALLKRLLTLIVVTVLLAACGAERAPLRPDSAPSNPADPTPLPAAGSQASTPRPSATLAASPTPTAQAPTATPTPIPRHPGDGFVWCEGPESCFDDGYPFPFQRPIPASIDPTYRYAATQNGDREIHRGVEFVRSAGTPVLAAGKGRVVFAGDDMDENVALWPGFYGAYVVILHDFGGADVFSLYAHLSRVDAWVGQQVVAGQEIGLVGASGSAIGSHLHFEVRYDQNTYFSTRNPELWFAPLEGAGALAGRIYDPDYPQVRGAVRIQRMEDGKITDFPAYQPMDIYPPELVVENGENFALNDLPAGQYRLTYLYNGKVYERFVEISPGILTLITIVLD